MPPIMPNKAIPCGHKLLPQQGQLPLMATIEAEAVAQPKKHETKFIMRMD